MRTEVFNIHEEHDKAKEVERWWRDRGQRFDLECFSRVGVMVFDGDTPMAASWLFLMNAPIAQIGFTCNNPDQPVFARGRATKTALVAILDMAKSLGFKRIMHLSSDRGLSKTLQKAGFSMLKPHDFYMGRL